MDGKVGRAFMAWWMWACTFLSSVPFNKKFLDNRGINFWYYFVNIWDTCIWYGFLEMCFITYIFIINLEIKVLMICLSRYIKTSGNATVDHLSKYLAVRLALEELRSKGESNQMNLDTASEKQYTIYIATASGQFTVSI